MARTRQRVRGRKDSGSFAQIPHEVLEHPNYAALHPRAVKLLWDLYAQYRGKNNGDLCAAFSVMKKKGWSSSDQLDKAKKELLARGWIIVTRQGGRNKPNLYAVTFRPIDECNNKLDVKPTITPLGSWKQESNKKIESVLRHTDQIDPSHGLIHEKIA